MRKFNEEDYKIVSKYEADFKRAIDSRFAKNIMTVEFDEINKIYRETLNRNANMSCGGCMLQMLTSVGRLYFAFKKDYEERKAKEEAEKKSQKTRTRSRRTSTKNKEDNKDVHKDKIEVQGSEGNPGDESNN